MIEIIEKTMPEAIPEIQEVINEFSISFPICPKCDKPIINDLYCINCGTFIKQLPKKSRPIKRRHRRK